ncbi:MAG: hypothetical protein IPM21_03410 [Acidobacteria bacterium]|nr:hypothetical protein [Acidobacteriota bacterium]
MTAFLIIAGLVILVWLAYQATPDGFKFFPDRRRKDAFSRSELVSALLKLDDASLSTLFEIYKNEFGPGPARYARQTYKKWKSGEVRAANQTFRRLFEHMPRVMPFDLKCEVLRHFMEEFAAKDHHEIRVTTSDWEQKLKPLVHQMITKAFTSQLPAEVEKKLAWLGEGDMQAAQEILRRSQVEESRIMVSDLQNEFNAINRLLSEPGLRPRVKHVLEFPYGTITLHISREAKANGR